VICPNLSTQVCPSFFWALQRQPATQTERAVRRWYVTQILISTLSLRDPSWPHTDPLLVFDLCSASESSGTSESPDIPSLGSSFQSGSSAVPSGVQGAAGNSLLPSAAPVLEDEEFDDVDQYTNHDVVERAFEVKREA